MKLTRRSFFATGMALAAGSVLPRAAEARPGELATLLDVSKCIACEACVAACRETNGHKVSPARPFPKMYPAKVKAADWSDKQDVDDRLTPYNWLSSSRRPRAPTRASPLN